MNDNSTTQETIEFVDKLLEKYIESNSKDK